MKIHGRHLEFIPGAALGASAGLVKKDPETGKKLKPEERALMGLVGTALGGSISSQIGRLSAATRAANIMQKNAPKNTFSFNSINSTGKFIPKYEDLYKIYKGKAQNAGLGKRDSIFSSTNIDDILSDFKTDISQTNFNTKIVPEIKKTQNAFFGIRKNKIDTKETEKIYSKYSPHIKGHYEASRKGNLYSEKIKRDLGNTEFSSLNILSKNNKLFTKDNNPITTKKTITKMFRDQAKKTHPDRGGNAEDFKKVKNQYNEIKNSPLWEKLAYYTLLN